MVIDMDIRSDNMITLLIVHYYLEQFQNQNGEAGKKVLNNYNYVGAVHIHKM